MKNQIYLTGNHGWAGKQPLWHANCVQLIRQVKKLPVSTIKDNSMLNLAITLFVLAIIAAVFGFGGIAGSLSGFAQIAFFVFIVLFLLSAFSSAFRGRSPV
jgi:uncharacterized membrane protein YtjA (UPF0391 family)